MFKQLTMVLGAIGIALITSTATAYAWKTSQSASAKCEGSHPIIKWEFKNTEPNKQKWAMDVKVTDSNSKQSQGKFTAKPGETVKGQFDISGHKLDKGSVKFDLTWTDGRSGVDSFTAKYSAVECQPEMIEVCRDGQVVKIEKDDRKSTDTEQPCPVAEEPIEVCRDGKIITIKADERLETDTDACVLSEEELPAQLPVTGPGSIIAGFIGSSTLFASVRYWLDSRKMLSAGLLNKTQ